MEGIIETFWINVFIWLWIKGFMARCERTRHFLFDMWDVLAVLLYLNLIFKKFCLLSANFCIWCILYPIFRDLRFLWHLKLFLGRTWCTDALKPRINRSWTSLWHRWLLGQYIFLLIIINISNLYLWLNFLIQTSRNCMTCIKNVFQFIWIFDFFSRLIYLRSWYIVELPGFL